MGTDHQCLQHDVRAGFEPMTIERFEPNCYMPNLTGTSLLCCVWEIFSRGKCVAPIS